MAIRIHTDDPNGLLTSIRRQIDGGHIDTWSYDADGDFTHCVDQFNKKAWLRPEISENVLTLRIRKPRGKNLSRAIFAIYHGRFIEMLITHVSALFSRAAASSHPAAKEPALVG